MTHTLETLLVRIRDGVAVGGDHERAVELVRADARLPEDLRALAQVEGSDAAGLLAVLGADDLSARLAEAIRFEAGDVADLRVGVDDDWDAIADALREGLAQEARGVDVSDRVVRRLGASGFPWGAVLADAVEAEAGGVALADDVVDELAFPVSEALFAEAGAVDLADAVMASLGIASVPVAEAVRGEAEPADHDLFSRIADAVMAEVAPSQALPPAANDPTFREARDAGPEAAEARPRRRVGGWAMGLVALAAAALIAVMVGRFAGPSAESPPLLFAQAGDVVVEDLRYGDGVQVFQIEGEQGAVILWVDEGA